MKSTRRQALKTASLDPDIDALLHALTRSGGVEKNTNQHEAVPNLAKKPSKTSHSKKPDTAQQTIRKSRDSRTKSRKALASQVPTRVLDSTSRKKTPSSKNAAKQISRQPRRTKSGTPKPEFGNKHRNVRSLGSLRSPDAHPYKMKKEEIKRKESEKRCSAGEKNRVPASSSTSQADLSSTDDEDAGALVIAMKQMADARKQAQLRRNGRVDAYYTRRVHKHVQSALNDLDSMGKKFESSLSEGIRKIDTREAAIVEELLSMRRSCAVQAKQHRSIKKAISKEMDDFYSKRNSILSDVANASAIRQRNAKMTCEKLLKSTRATVQQREVIETKLRNALVLLESTV